MFQAYLEQKPKQYIAAKFSLQQSSKHNIQESHDHVLTHHTEVNELCPLEFGMRKLNLLLYVRFKNKKQTWLIYALNFLTNFILKLIMEKQSCKDWPLWSELNSGINFFSESTLLMIFWQCSVSRKCRNVWWVIFRNQLIGWLTLRRTGLSIILP